MTQSKREHLAASSTKSASETLLIKVKPNSRETKIISQTDSEMMIALAAPPTDGRANLELIKFLKKTFKKDVEILRGKTSRTKLIRLFS